MPSEIKILNIDDIKNRLFSLERMFPGAIKSIMKQIAGILLKSVVDKTPVDTGNLRRKWALGEVKADANEASVEVINNAEYAVPVEYGHKAISTKKKKGGKRKKEISKKIKKPAKHHFYVPGVFMLRRGMDEVVKNAPMVIENEMQRFVNKAVK